MPIKNFIAAGISILGVLSLAAPATANCFPNQNCNPRSVVVDPYRPQFDSVTVRNREPLDYLSSVEFQNSPNVSITRVHGLNSDIGLADAPVKFKNGCNPSSSAYCRTGARRAIPVAAAPARPQLRTWVGGGYDPAKFAPRQYGNLGFTPGVAHIPTSIVDRSPENADRVLNSGRTRPQAIANGGVAPRPAGYGPRGHGQAGPYGQFLQGPVQSGAILAQPSPILAPNQIPAFCYRPGPLKFVPHKVLPNKCVPAPVFAPQYTRSNGLPARSPYPTGSVPVWDF